MKPIIKIGWNSHLYDITRPDTMYVVSLINRYMSKSTQIHLQEEREC